MVTYVPSVQQTYAARDVELLSKDFARRWESTPEHRLVMPVVKRYTAGSRYILGGYVSATLSNIVNGTPIPEQPDLDITAEHLLLNGHRPAGYSRTKNSFNGVKLRRDELELDLSSLQSDWQYVNEYDLPRTIWSVFFGGPLTTSAIAYDLDRKQLIGEPGIRSVLTATMDVHNLRALQNAAYRKKGCRTIGDYVRGRNEHLGFEIADDLERLLDTLPKSL